MKKTAYKYAYLSELYKYRVTKMKYFKFQNKEGAMVWEKQDCRTGLENANNKAFSFLDQGSL